MGFSGKNCGHVIWHALKKQFMFYPRFPEGNCNLKNLKGFYGWDKEIGR